MLEEEEVKEQEVKAERGERDRVNQRVSFSSSLTREFPKTETYPIR